MASKKQSLAVAERLMQSSRDRIWTDGERSHEMREQYDGESERETESALSILHESDQTPFRKPCVIHDIWYLETYLVG